MPRVHTSAEATQSDVAALENTNMKDDKQCTMQLVIAMLVQSNSASRDSDHGVEVHPVGLAR